MTVLFSIHATSSHIQKHILHLRNTRTAILTWFQGQDGNLCMKWALNLYACLSSCSVLSSKLLCAYNVTCLLLKFKTTFLRAMHNVLNRQFNEKYSVILRISTAYVGCLNSHLYCVLLLKSHKIFHEEIYSCSRWSWNFLHLWNPKFNTVPWHFSWTLTHWVVGREVVAAKLLCSRATLFYGPKEDIIC
jgi:hypothetical protein